MSDDFSGVLKDRPCAIRVPKPLRIASAFKACGQGPVTEWEVWMAIGNALELTKPVRIATREIFRSVRLVHLNVGTFQREGDWTVFLEALTGDAGKSKRTVSRNVAVSLQPKDIVF